MISGFSRTYIGPRDCRGVVDDGLVAMLFAIVLVLINHQDDRLAGTDCLEQLFDRCCSGQHVVI
jgi:hypothetical protein